MTTEKDRQVELETGKMESPWLKVAGFPTDRTLFLVPGKNNAKNTNSGLVVIDISPDGKAGAPLSREEGSHFGTDRSHYVTTDIDYPYVRLRRAKPEQGPVNEADNYSWTLFCCAADEGESESAAGPSAGTAVPAARGRVIRSGHMLPAQAVVDVTVMARISGVPIVKSARFHTGQRRVPLTGAMVQAPPIGAGARTPDFQAEFVDGQLVFGGVDEATLWLTVLEA